jgi:hypothetical protein
LVKTLQANGLLGRIFYYSIVGLLAYGLLPEDSVRINGRLAMMEESGIKKTVKIGNAFEYITMIDTSGDNRPDVKYYSVAAIRLGCMARMPMQITSADDSLFSRVLLEYEKLRSENNKK